VTHLNTLSEFLQLGFVGLGNMGLPMVTNLLKKGDSVRVFDLNESAVKQAVSLGAVAVSNAGDVCKGSEGVITMLPAGKHVTEVYEKSLFPSAAKGTMFMDCSTIEPMVSQELVKKAHGQGFRMVDAPVSGGVNGAAAGTLTFMVGADTQQDFELSKSMLKNMGSNFFHCGKAGTGEVAKIANNLVLAISMTAVSEAFNLGTKLGMDPKVLSSILNVSTGRCWSSEVYSPYPGILPNAPSSREYAGGFGAALMAKDLGIAVSSGSSASVALPLSKHVLELYNDIIQSGNGGKDFSVIIQHLKKLNP
jgi:3-hydroxyisobutyrate dehydrogenase